MRPPGAEAGCAGCPFMREGSSFDGIHLFCEQRQLWTNLLDPRWAGGCLEDDERAGAPALSEQARAAYFSKKETET